MTRGLSAQGGICLGGRVSAQGVGCLPRGVPRGGVQLPPVKQTDTCKNITFPQLLLRMVKITPSNT